jgi:hypothetical protein
MKPNAVCVSSNCLKDLKRDVMTLNKIHGVCGRQLLEMWKQAQKLTELVVRDRQLAVRLMQDQLHINRETVHRILLEGL